MKLSFSILLASGAIIGFTGCGPKALTTGYMKDPSGSSANITVAPSEAFLTSSRINETVNYTLQIAAEATLKENHKYFAIVEPELISNINPENPNNALEYSDKCANNNIAKAIFVYTNPCLVAKGNLKDILGGSMRIMMYNDLNRPVQMKTYDAAQVLNELRANDLYDPRGLAM